MVAVSFMVIAPRKLHDRWCRAIQELDPRVSDDADDPPA
jgi:hypothetical protein